MALINCNFFSYTLGMDSSMTVLLPEKRQQPHIPNPDKKYPVLYLLHGHSDDNTSWLRKSLIELLVRDYDIIVVMPNAHRSFYTDSKHGHRYFKFFSQELPVVVGNFFPASNKREDNYVAGLSMGGYGALKLALNCPDRFAAAGCLSGAISPSEALEAANRSSMFTVSDFEENFYNVFGGKEEMENTANDLFHVADELDKKDVPKPRIYHSCGKGDPLYNTNIAFRDYMMKRTSFDYTFEESGGGHNWDFWNRELPAMLRKFGIINDPNGLEYPSFL
ncbi:alpha/beta hydrolase family protein [Paenibacillus sp. J2TS4]|uniref:alpha/beta hydrolase n=1 Tax=Paenibacillus sp. J2TS4 TaxID=2807194 RepID=UPI001B28F2AD|nr:alpha/beta hydrolase family protein [Paenibacillus sp. J2TS4]GIP34906.1 esterase [Paenibacillus sp. J2TS4]